MTLEKIKRSKNVANNLFVCTHLCSIGNSHRVNAPRPKEVRTIVRLLRKGFFHSRQE